MNLTSEAVQLYYCAREKKYIDAVASLRIPSAEAAVLLDMDSLNIIICFDNLAVSWVTLVPKSNTLSLDFKRYKL